MDKMINEDLIDDIFRSMVDDITRIDRVDLVNSRDYPVDTQGSVWHAPLTQGDFYTLIQGDFYIDRRKRLTITLLSRTVTFDRPFTLENLYLCLSEKGALKFRSEVHLPLCWNAVGNTLTVDPIDFTLDTE